MENPEETGKGEPYQEQPEQIESKEDEQLQFCIESILAGYGCRYTCRYVLYIYTVSVACIRMCSFNINIILNNDLLSSPTISESSTKSTWTETWRLPEISVRYD